MYYYLAESAGGTWLVTAATPEEAIAMVPDGTGRAKIVGQTAEPCDLAPLLARFERPDTTANTAGLPIWRWLKPI
jgi:hypothetical protein